MSWWVQLQITESLLADLNREGFNVVNKAFAKFRAGGAGSRQGFQE